MVVTVPVIPFSTWIWAAFDPILILVAVYLGWTADQAGKVFIAAIAALGAALLADALITRIGLPWFAPLSRDGPMLIPVRSVGAVVWAAMAYGARRLRDCSRDDGRV